MTSPHPIKKEILAVLKLALLFIYLYFAFTRETINVAKVI